jgi:cell division protein FtsI/penicillin-binding protein 2
MLLAIRQGMKLVPETSTARAAFARTGDIKCRAYGKTGTAEIVKQTGQHSAWFIGWREPKGKPLTAEERRQRRLNNLDIHPRERRLVYACMTTHGFGGFRTGGSSCAPIVADTLVAMEKKEEPKKKKARPGRRARRN